jgi:aminoglycoside 6-adenylyltransferase
VAITFLEPTPVGGVLERRVLFADGADVDFSVAPAELLEEPDRFVGAAADVLGRGVRVLVDTDGALDSLLSRVPPRRPPEPPSQDDLTEIVNDFWYHAVWAARKLRRGEVFTAKGCVDAYMKRLILRVLAWHAQAAGNVDTWHEGRFLEGWADPRALERLRAAYGHYDEDDVRRALLATMDLFSWLAAETAERHGLAYPAETESYAVVLVERLL